jgi:hypothetical protein
MNLPPLAVFQAFSLRTEGSTKLRIFKVAFPKLKFWESLKPGINEA